MIIIPLAMQFGWCQIATATLVHAGNAAGAEHCSESAAKSCFLSVHHNSFLVCDCYSCHRLSLRPADVVDWHALQARSSRLVEGQPPKWHCDVIALEWSPPTLLASTTIFCRDANFPGLQGWEEICVRKCLRGLLSSVVPAHDGLISCVITSAIVVVNRSTLSLGGSL
jgi:hypothetical protein